MKKQKTKKKAEESPHLKRIGIALLLAILCTYRTIAGSEYQILFYGCTALFGYYVIKEFVDYMGFKAYKQQYPDENHTYLTYLAYHVPYLDNIRDKNK